MGIPDWIVSQPARFRQEGFRTALSQSKREVTDYLFEKVDAIDWRGKPIYTEQWDALVILDGCRADVLQSITHEYEFLPSEIGSVRSLASVSRTWMDQNFTEDYAQEMAETAYVTSNPYSESHLDEQDFLLVDEVWKYAWDNDVGTVHARSVTDRAIATMREYDPDRLLVHYMQPHFPSIPDPLGSGIEIDTFGNNWNSVWDQLRNGEINEQTVEDSYKENLRYVLDDVHLLLENIDAEQVIISADHGNAFGEYGRYGHPPRLPIDAIRTVPWVLISGKDSGGYNPNIENEQISVEESEVDQRLRDLGYL